MRLSEIKREDAFALSDEQVERIVFSGIEDSGLCAEVALLLGSSPESCASRADAAAELYFAGRVKYIVPSGGVLWEHCGEMISEADFMTRRLVAAGVPSEVIIPENEARTTKENMICGALQINRNINFYNVGRVCIVTSDFHLRRSLALARVFLPRTVEVIGYAARSAVKWSADPLSSENARREIPLLKSLVDHKMIEDIEF